MRCIMLLLASLWLGFPAYSDTKHVETEQATALPKLVVLTPSTVEMVYAVGAGEQIVGVVEYSDYPLAAKAILRVGRYNYLDIEQILLLAPDYILLSFQDTSKALIEQLQQFDLPLVDTSIHQLDDIPKQLISLGELTGHPAQGQQQAQAFAEQLTALRQQYREQTPIKVFYQIASQPLMTTANGWLSQIIQDCGGINVFDGSVGLYPQINLEQVLAKQPEVIFASPSSGNPQGVDWQVWTEIPAVSQQQLYSIDSDLIHRAGPRVLQGMTQLCQFLAQARAKMAHNN